jgi:3-dehydroquinate synthase
MQMLRFRQLYDSLKNYQFFVIDKKVYDLHFKDNKILINKTIFWVKDPEAYKSFKHYESALKFFIENNIRRSDTIVCIGGGATTDLGGFVASTVLRGVHWIAVPTTLLAMVDASIGGKVGINLNQGKNLVGQFYLPKSELVCTDFLNTLDQHQLQSGYGEIIKYYFLSKKLHNLLDRSDFSQEELIKTCIEFKKKLVEEDFKEKGQRKALNFGHTFGHAIEKILGVEHGIAIALGIKMNLLLFFPEGLNDFNRLVSQFKIELPQKKLKWKDFEYYLSFDNKNTNKESIHFVILNQKLEQYEYRNIKTDELKLIFYQKKQYENFFQ